MQLNTANKSEDVSVCHIMLLQNCHKSPFLDVINFIQVTIEYCVYQLLHTLIREPLTNEDVLSN